MANCYLCNSPLTTENRSNEHVILNALGGKLSSTELLCKDCNSKLGEEGDAELAKQLNHFSSYLNIKRERGENPPLKNLRDTNGREYVVYDGATPVYADPIVQKKDNDGKTEYSIQARNTSEAERMVEQIGRKNKNFNVEEIKKAIVAQREYLAGPLTINFKIGGELAFRSVTKTAVNYYILNGGSRDNVKHLFPFIKGIEYPKTTILFFPENYVCDLNDGEILHILHLVGDNQSKLLYCYVEFFNACCFLILLSKNYNGDSIQNTYCYNVLTREQPVKDVQLTIEPTDFELESKSFEVNMERYKNRCARTLNIGDKIHTNNRLDAIANEAFDRLQLKYGNNPPMTKAIVQEYQEDVKKEVDKFIAYKQSQN